MSRAEAPERSSGAADSGDAADPAGAEPVLLSEEELAAWGRRLGEVAARRGTFVALVGPLGAGKSTVTRAAARGAGVEGAVPSPTYTLVQEHAIPGGAAAGGFGDGAAPGRTFFHVDLYRLSGARDLEEIGWDRLLGGDGPVFVEWADRAEGALPRDRWEVRLAIPGDRSLRRVSVRRVGAAPEPPRPDAAGTDPNRPDAEGGDSPC